MADLFDPVALGDIALANRIVMAPMTRSRAGAGDAPTDIAVEYYRQRAGAGLVRRGLGERVQGNVARDVGDVGPDAIKAAWIVKLGHNASASF